MSLAIGGDETGALVSDIGREWSRFGFAGDDMPKCLMKSDMVYEGLEDEESLEKRQSLSAEVLPSPMESSAQIATKNSIDLMACEEDRSVWDELRMKDARTARSVALLASRRWNFGEDAAGLGLKRVIEDRLPEKRRIFIRNPVDENGELSDWDAIEALWTEAEERLKTSCQEHPVLCGIPSWTSVRSQEQYLEILFESLNAPAAYLARNAMLSTLANGRSSALVLDIGAAITSAVPVIDGYVLLRAVNRSKRSGRFLDDELNKILKEKKGMHDIVPRSCLRNNFQATTEELMTGLREKVPTILSLAQRDIVTQCKHTFCFLPGSRGRPGGTFELPDGTGIDVDTSIALLPERFFLEGAPKENNTENNMDTTPDPVPTHSIKQETNHEDESSKPQKLDPGRLKEDTNTLDKATENKTATTTQNPSKPDPARSSYYASPALTTFRKFDPPSFHSIPTLVRAALERSDVDVRKDLLNNIILAGGSSLFPGLPERIHRELADNLAPTRLKTKLIIASPVERQFSVWIGASILASLGSFQQMWLSKQEYHEDGALANLERWT